MDRSEKPNRRNAAPSDQLSPIQPPGDPDLPDYMDVVLDLEAAMIYTEGVEETSTDSVFVLSPSNSAIPTDPMQPTIEIESDSPKMARLSLPSDGGSAVCRICHCSEKSCPFGNGEPLISPCHCRGSTGLYHRSCLERWLSTVNKDKCEICKFQYHVEKEPRKFTEFLCKPGSKSIRRHMISDAACWLILTPTAAVGAWLCISGAIYRSTTVKPEEYGQAPLLIGLAVFLILTYVVWNCLCVRYHAKIWRRWCTRNYRIRVLDSEEAKKKRRAVSKDDLDVNNNQGFQLRWIRTSGRQSGNHANGSPSVVSQGTHYSTPWTSIPGAAQHPAPVHSPPYESGPSTIFEPRAMIPFQEIIL